MADNKVNEGIKEKMQITNTLPIQIQEIYKYKGRFI